MFEGFSKSTFEFFSAISFNNNREFFLQNHDWYVQSVREPARALAAALGDSVNELDPSLERRPEKVVSRLNRDVRFSKDKSPYRDYVWLAFRRPGVERATTMGVFFDVGLDGCRYGMGYYSENKPVMNALRREILHAPEHVQQVTERALERFRLETNAYKRMAIPPDVPDSLRSWYNLKGFYVVKDITDYDLIYSPKLADEVADGFRHLKQLYDFILTLPLAEEDLLTGDKTRLMERG
ncbi:DUF2461 domain-containing protein [Eubacteriales bacterium OttesenSCG-928-N13]|nr:DUF2461 domain-containing protein [Eubacteriales bacterium OttesenSCG-928-N13]